MRITGTASDRGSGVRLGRRQLLLAGAVATAGTVLAGVEEAIGQQTAGTANLAGRDYGSGQLGPWEHQRRAVSATAQIKRVVAGDGVFLFGDSLMMQDGNAFATQLFQRTGLEVAAHNWAGRPTKPAVDALETWAHGYGLPRRILMATGANDIFAPPKFGAEVDRVMRIAGAERTVYWVNIQVARTRYPMEVQLADQRNSGWINLQLATAARRYPNLRIVPWAEHLASAPELMKLYLRDGIHTSVPAGQQARNKLMVDALAGP